MMMKFFPEFVPLMPLRAFPYSSFNQIKSFVSISNIQLIYMYHSICSITLFITAFHYSFHCNHSNFPIKSRDLSFIPYQLVNEYDSHMYQHTYFHYRTKLHIVHHVELCYVSLIPNVTMILLSYSVLDFPLLLLHP